MTEEDSKMETLIVKYEDMDRCGHVVGGLYAQRNGFEASVFTYPPSAEEMKPSVHVVWKNPLQCGNCDAHTHPVEVGGGKYRLETSTPGAFTFEPTPCPYPHGIISTFTLEVPSGRLAVADSLWGECKNLENPDISDTKHDYNSALGRSEYYKLTEAAGIAYGAVSNSSPGLYLDTATNTLYVANVGSDPVTEEECDAPETWKEIAEITTDLWAYSIMDYDHYVIKGGNPDAKHVGFPEVPAGTYKFTHYADQTDFHERSYPITIYAKAELVTT